MNAENNLIETNFYYKNKHNMTEKIVVEQIKIGFNEIIFSVHIFLI